MHDRAEQTDRLGKHLAGQSGQSEAARVEERYHPIIIEMLLCRALQLLIGRTVAPYVTLLKGNNGTGMAVIAVLPGDKHHHLPGRTGRELIEAGPAQLLQHSLIGHMIALPQLHIRARGSQCGHFQTLLHPLRVNRSGRVEMPYGPPMFQNLL